MIILFKELNIFTIIISLILSLFKIKIYYFSISKIFRNKKIIIFLEKFAIVFLNYHIHKKKLIPDTLVKAQKISAIVANKISQKLMIKKKDLKKFFINKLFLEIYIQRGITNSICEYLNYFESANYVIGKKNNKKIIFFLQSNFYLSTILKDYNNFIVISFLSNIKNYILHLTQLITQFTKLIINYFSNIININKLENKKIDINKHNVGFKSIYFTNDGIIENNNIIDFFFLKDDQNKFKFSDTAVIELKKKKFYSKENFSYVKKNKITLFFHENLKYFLNKGDILSILKINLNLFYKYNLSLSFFILKFLIEVKKNESRLDEFKDTKVAFVSYEYLFPIGLAAACYSHNIKLVGLQRRMHLPMHLHYIYLDYYFLFGKKCLPFLKKNQPAKIKYLPTGRLINLKYKLKKQNSTKLKCVVFDFSSQLNWYDDAILNDSNWEINRNFYSIIIRLAKKFRNINFYIKSKKRQNWMKLNYFKKVNNEIIKLDNLSFIRNNKSVNSISIIQKYDFAIGKHSSVLDEFLMINKPAIIYENPLEVKKFLDYGDSISCYSEKNLHYKVSKILKNFRIYNNKLLSSRNILYFKFNKKKFFQNLRQIYHDNVLNK